MRQPKTLKNSEPPYWKKGRFQNEEESREKNEPPSISGQIYAGRGMIHVRRFFHFRALFPHEGNPAIPAYYIDLPRGADNGIAYRADIFDTAVLGFAAAFLSFAVTFRQAGRVDRVVA